jgi:phage terminase large subunit
MADWKEAWLQSPKDPLTFVEGVLGVDAIEDWQRKALTALRDGETRLSIRSGHGVGKTTFLAWLVLWGLTCWGKDTKIPVGAGSQDQLRDTVQPEIAKWRERLPPLLRDLISVDNEKISFAPSPSDAFAVFRTASKDNPQALAGFHAENLMFLLDEASAIHEKAYEVAMGALSTEGAILVMTGNPTESSGYFYDSHTLLADRFWTLRVSSEEVPRARGHIEDVIQRFGADSNEYRVRVLGEFPKAGPDSLIPMEWVEAAIVRDVAPMKVLPVWGLDPARGGDRSALCKRRGNTVMEPIKVFNQKDTMTLCGLILREWDNTEIDERPHEICVDVIGIGAGVVDRLSELGLPVRGVNVGESASIDDTFMRLRDQLHWKLREWFEARNCKIPNDRALISELTVTKYRVLSSGRVQVESKDDMKKRLAGKSPDLADALMLTFAADDRQRMLADRDRHRQSHRATSGWAA